MDFSKVRLADFAQAQLRRARATLPAEAQSSSHEQPAEAAVSDVVAQAPQYSARLTSLVAEVVAQSDGLRDLQYDTESEYLLAVNTEGVYVWKRGAKSSLLFPLPQDHEVKAMLVSSAPTLPSVQPGLVVADCQSGAVTYWESINRAVGATATPSERGVFGTESVRIPLGRKERVEQAELVTPVGLVVVTTHGHFYLINLRNDVGKRSLTLTEMKAGSTLFARLRTMGAFARDIVAIRPGNTLEDVTVRELFTVNTYGDISLWHVGLNSYSELVGEVRAGQALRAQMNLLYPNCEVSLIVHDIAIESNLRHVLASFAPQADSSLRNFVIMSLNAELETVSVKRLRAYESSSFGPHTSLQVGNGVLVAAFDDAIVFLDSPSRSAAVISRWEEGVFLKPEAHLTGSASVSDGSVVVFTSMGVLQFDFSDSRIDKSTTITRLEQLVFETSDLSPLDFSRWPEFEMQPDSNAAVQLASEIANSRTPFVPVQLPNVRDHLNLRASKLEVLYQYAPSQDVREATQAVVAGASACGYLESGDTGAKGVSQLIERALRKLDPPLETLKDLFMSHILSFPQVLDAIAKNPADKGNANVLLEVLGALTSNKVGVPRWVQEGPVRTALESLTSQAADSRDPELLSRTTKLLCAVYSSFPDKSSVDCPMIKSFLCELAQFDGKRAVALQIARTYRVHSALAPLELGNWCDRGCREDELDSIDQHITELGPAYAEAVFESCVARKQASLLVTRFAARHAELVKAFLARHKLYEVAWTLDPGTPESTAQLALASKHASDNSQRLVYASLYKLSAYATSAESLPEAQLELDLAEAQNSLARQFGSADSQPSSAVHQSPLLKHGLAQMKQLLDRQTTVDLLVLAPPHPIPESNSNFILGFKIVEPQDIVRQRLLVQQLVCNTNWERVTSSAEPARSNRLKQTLFYHTLQNVAPVYQTQLMHFRASLCVSGKAEIKRSYSWDGAGAVPDELARVAQLATSIADKYGVDELVREMAAQNQSMEVDG